jgi:hypothetical protein
MRWDCRRSMAVPRSNRPVPAKADGPAHPPYPLDINPARSPARP